MSAENYNRDSVDAMLSRVETKIDILLAKEEHQDRQIGKLWAALGRLDVRVAVIAGSVSTIFVVGKVLLALIK